MTHLRLAIRTACLGLGPREAIRAAAGLGVRGVQLDAVGELSARALSESGRRDLAHLLRMYELELVSLAVPTVGLAGPNALDAALAELGAAFELSRALGSGVVTVATGRLPESTEDPLWAEMRQGVDAVGSLASHCGGVAALAAGADRADVLARFLDQFDTDGLGANVYPAGFLASGFDPVESTRALGAHVVHTQVRDARRAGPLGQAEETRFGEGQVDWAGWLATLAEVDYSGFVTLETGLAGNPVGRLGEAIEFLGRF